MGVSGGIFSSSKGHYMLDPLWLENQSVGAAAWSVY